MLANDLPGVAQVRVFLSHAMLSFSGFVTINDPYSASQGAQDPVPWEVGLSPVGEGRLGPALAAEGPSRRRQRAPVGAERRGGGAPPSLCRREGRGGHSPGAARPSGGAGQGVGGGAHPCGQRSGCLQGRATDATASAAALVGQLGAERRAHQLTKGALDEALAAAEASRTKAVIWRGTVEGEF